MNNFFKIISVLFITTILTACGPKDVQPIQSLSGIETGEFNLANVNVELSPEFIAQFDNRVKEEEENIQLQKDKIENPTGRTSFRRREAAKVAQTRLEESEKKIVSIKEQMVEVDKDVRDGIKEELANKFSGSRSIDLDISINSFAMTNGGAVVLVGGSDSMTGLVKITDSQTSELLGEYHITDMDTNAAGGLLGLMVRGSDPKGDMIRQFSEKIIGVLNGEYSD